MEKKHLLWNVVAIMVIVGLLIILGFLAYDLAQKRAVTKKLISMLKDSQYTIGDDKLISVEAANTDEI